MNMIFKRKLLIPKEIKEMYPISPEGAEAKRRNDALVRDVITGASDRLLLVIGPCSADREDAVVEYISRLRGLQDRVADKIVILGKGEKGAELLYEKDFDLPRDRRALGVPEVDALRSEIHDLLVGL